MKFLIFPSTLLVEPWSSSTRPLLAIIPATIWSGMFVLVGSWGDKVSLLIYAPVFTD